MDSHTFIIYTDVIYRAYKEFMVSTEQVISLRADVNYWVGRNFPEQRKYISHSNPILIDENEYQVNLHLKNDGEIIELGKLKMVIIPSNHVPGGLIGGGMVHLCP